MKSVKTTILGLLLAFICQGEDYAVVVNPGNPVNDISAKALERIYTGKVKELGGNMVVPINLPEGNSLATEFLKQIVGKSYEDYTKFWVEQQIKGLGTAPMVQKDANAAKAIVSNVPGGVAYIPASEVDDSVKRIAVK